VGKRPDFMLGLPTPASKRAPLVSDNPTEAPINKPLSAQDLSGVASQPRAIGAARLTVGPSGLRGLRQSGSMRVLFPRQTPGWPQAVLLNTSGGVTGGDRFAVEADAEPASRLTVTTQAAERIYRAQPGETGYVDTRLTIGAGGRIDWLPQETILFEQSSLRRRLSVNMARDASLLVVEPMVFGRRAMGEVLHDIRLSDRIEIFRDGACLFTDATRLTGDVSRQMQGHATGHGATALATVIFAAPGAEAFLGDVRDLLPETGGASLIRPDLLFIRILAEDSFALRARLIPVITVLHRADLPRTWML
jgi:urease accessory protein